MMYLVLRVDFDAGEDGARWMVVPIDETSFKRYNAVHEAVNGLDPSMSVRKIVMSESPFQVFRINPLKEGMVPETLNDEGCCIALEEHIDFASPDIRVEYCQSHLDIYGEICYTCDYKHTDYGIRSCYIPISLFSS